MEKEWREKLIRIKKDLLFKEEDFKYDCLIKSPCLDDVLEEGGFKPNTIYIFTNLNSI